MSASDLDAAKTGDTNKIVFSYDFETFEYNISFYRAKMSRNKLPKHELMSFFKNMYLKVNDFHDLKELSSSLFKTAILSVTLLVIGLFIAVYGYFFISNAWLILAGFCVVLVACTYIFAFLRRQKKVRSQVVQKIRGCINKFLDENSNNFEKKKVKWCLPNDHFEWIELYVDDSLEFPVATDSLMINHKMTEGDKLVSDLSTINIGSPKETDRVIEI
jgi:hypothetical protein